MSEEKYNMDGYSAMCAAVVTKAIQDYRLAIKMRHRHPSNISASKTINDCERFFCNEISFYSDLDGKMIMRKVQEQVRRELHYGG